MSLKGSTCIRSRLAYNPYFNLALTAIYNTIKCKDDMYYVYINSCFNMANLISPSNGNPCCVLNFKQQIIRIIIIIGCFKVSVSPCQPSWADMFSWALITPDRWPWRRCVLPKLDWLAFYLLQIQGDLIVTEDRWRQLQIGPRFYVYLPIQFLPPVQSLHLNGTFVWADGGTPSYEMF